MSIADKITSIEGHLTDDYEGLENLGADLTNVNKNIQNIRTCLDNIYSNIPKTTGEGSNLSLTTLKGRINVDDILGDTQQDTTNGYQLLNVTLAKLKTYNTSGTWNNNVYTISGVTITINDDMSIKVNGTATAQVGLLIAGGAIPYPTGTYYLSGAINGSNDTYDVRIYNYDGTSVVAQCFTGTKQVAIVNNSQSFNMAVIVRSGVTCNNTMFYPMLSTTNTSNYEPYTNGASPNPTYPQEIEVVRGKNRLNLENCTKLGNATRTNETSNSVELTGIGAWSNGTYIFPNFAINTDLRISLKLKSSVARTTGITIYGTNTNDTSSLTSISEDTSSLTSNTEKEYSVIFNSGNYKYICMRIWTNYSTTTLDKAILEATEIMLLEGSQATSYLPYNTQEVVVQNKNIYDSSYRTPDNTILCAGGTCTEENGVFTIQATRNDMYVWNVQSNGSTYSAYQNQLIDFIENPYTITITNSLFTKNFITFYDADKKVLNFKQFNTNIFTFTKGQDYSVPSEAKYFSLRFGINDSVSGTTYTTSVQIELGSTATPYTPHQEQTKTLHLGDIELAKIGTYQDRIYKNSDKWYIEKNTGKVVLNGSETGWGTQNDVFCIEINDILTQSYDERSIIVLSNYFLGARTAYRGGINNLMIAKTIDNGKPKQLGIRYDALNNVVADFKTWLSTHNTIVYYVLSTPTYEEITNETLIEELNELEKMYSYSGQTNINVNGNLPMIINITALKGE